MWISKSQFNILNRKARMYEETEKKLLDAMRKNVDFIDQLTRNAEENKELRDSVFRQSQIINEWKQKYADEVQKRLNLLHYMSGIYLKGEKDEQPCDN